MFKSVWASVCGSLFGIGVDFVLVVVELGQVLFFHHERKVLF